MCLVRLGSLRVEVHRRAPRLSSNILIFWRLFVSRVVFNFKSDLASLAASLRAIYSASLVLSATIDCWCDLQLIAPPLYMKIHPVVDLLLFKSDAKSASAYPKI